MPAHTTYRPMLIVACLAGVVDLVVYASLTLGDHGTADAGISQYRVYYWHKRNRQIQFMNTNFTAVPRQVTFYMCHK